MNISGIVVMGILMLLIVIGTIIGIGTQINAGKTIIEILSVALTQDILVLDNIIMVQTVDGMTVFQCIEDAMIGVQLVTMLKEIMSVHLVILLIKNGEGKQPVNLIVQMKLMEMVVLVESMMMEIQRVNIVIAGVVGVQMEEQQLIVSHVFLDII